MDEDRELTLSEWKGAFEALLKNPAFRRLTRAIQGQVDSLQQDILFKTFETESEMWLCERKKGSLEGRLSLMNTCNGILSEIEHEIVQRKKESQ